MKKLKLFIGLSISILFISTFAFSQKTSDTLAENATLAETQAWLVKVIGKNGTFHAGGAKKYLSDLKFDGSKFTYTMRSELVPGDSPEDNTPTGSDSNAREELGASSSATVFKFDLKDMDGDNVLVKPVPGVSKMSAVILQSMPGQNSVSVTTPLKRNSSLATKPTASMIVKDGVAEQIKAAFAHAIKLCQAPGSQP
jgi:hypothetical protein